MHPRRRGNREDDDDHAPDRVAGRERGVRAAADRGGHVHRQGGGRAARAAARRSASRVCAPRRSTRRRSRCSATSTATRAGSSRRRRSSCAGSATRCRAVPLPARRRPRDGDRVGEEPAAHTGDVPRPARRPRAADPGRSLAPGLPGVRAAQGRRAGRSTSRTCSSGRSRLLEDDARRVRAVHDRWRAFTVDEYQDVNLLQQSLLDLWLGERDDLCVGRRRLPVDLRLHGRERASGCSRCRERFPHAHVVRLERNYRSTPQVLELANRLVPQLGGSAKTLAPTLADGPEPVVGPALERRRRACGSCTRTGVPLEELAVLVRTNARTSRLRGGVPRCGDPVPGCVAARARRGAPAAEGAARPARAGRPRSCASSPFARGCSPRCRRSSASASRRGRPTSRGSSGSRSEFDGEVDGVRRAAARALRRQRGPRRPPPDAPPREGARVGGRVPAAGRGGRAAASRARRRRGGAAAASTSG